jgi:serine/threonine-protein kinase
VAIEAGSVVGDYQVIGVLGAGGMGKVFQVRNTLTGRIEAMKVLLPDLTGDPDLADRFLREIQVLASLSHPNIASLHTALRFENQLLMLMEFVEGRTLEDRLKEGRVPVAEAVNYISQALSALSFAHKRGVVHRDVKPANLMLTAGGVVKVMDFGIARAAGDRRLTMTGAPLGSLHYMSPEQIGGAETVDARSDVYSVGVSLYELVTGQRPFEGNSQFSVMAAHLEKDARPPISIDPSLPALLNEIILTAIRRDPEQRFQNADAFRNALGSVAGTALPQAKAPAPKSRRALWATVGALCVVAVLVAAVEFWPSRRADAGEPPPVTAPAAATPAAEAAPPAPSPAEPAPPASEPAVSSPARDAAPAPVVADTPKQPTRDVRPVASRPIPTPPPSQVVAAPAPAPPAVQQPPAPVADAQSQPSAVPDPVARRAELQQLRESLAQLSGRANGIRNTLQNLQRTQAASGLGLRRDWAEAATMLDAYVRGANDALTAGDAAAVRDLMHKAEMQADRLDKALK